MVQLESLDKRHYYYSYQLFTACSRESEAEKPTSAELTSVLGDEHFYMMRVEDAEVDRFFLLGSTLKPSDAVDVLATAWNSIFQRVASQSVQLLSESPRVRKIGHLWIPTSAATSLLAPSSIVNTETTATNLLYIAESVLINRPTIIQGDTGCGKLTLLKEIARVMGFQDKLVCLQLNDQSDGRSLLGSYICSDVPGEFKWQAGILTQAVVNGYWLVVQDIDKVPLDIIAMISSLLEFRTLSLPQRKFPLRAHAHFRLFATRSISQHTSSSSGGSSSALELLDASHLYTVPQLRTFSNLWYFINIQSLNSEEIEMVISAKYGSINAFYVNKILQLVSDKILLSTNTFSTASRSISLTKALKIASRLQRYAGTHRSDYITDRVKLFYFQDFVDVFCADARFEEQYIKSVELLGNFLGIPPSEVEHFLMHHIPDISQIDNVIQIGRCQVQLRDQQNNAQLTIHGNNTSFAQTRYAKKLLEKIMVCVEMREPVLLVGETGTGKTTAVQQLANIAGKELIVQNLSLSTDAGDLLGGFRPATIRDTLLPIYETFVRLFQDTMSSAKNTEFLQIVAQFFQAKKWSKLLQSFLKGCKSAITKLQSAAAKASAADSEHSAITTKLSEWQSLEESVHKYQVNLPKLETGFAFRVVKGLLVQAFEQGQWILLDEINLAPPETIQMLSRFLQPNEQEIAVEMNGGDLATIKRHPDFRVFAAMNPPTDVCKRELPASTRSKFTELYVEEMTDPQDLLLIVESYMKDIQDAPVQSVVDTYLGSRAAAEMNLTDGSGQRPRYSLRSLTRSLKAAMRFAKIGMRPINRCLLEGFLLNFQTCLSNRSKVYMYQYLFQSLFPSGDSKKLDFPPSKPSNKLLKGNNQQWVLVKPFWIPATEQVPPTDWSLPNEQGVTKFVATETVMQFLRTITSAVAASVAPILLQGPTSIGKTTVIQYLAAKLGYKCLRINNHEHTDVQEYVGGYVTGTDGKMIFQDGILVEALRNGYWIILDELNLAPSEVLEALNRLLDDNRELLIPETGEIIKPTEGFQLFATQNPPGIYGGRKPLSLAFRNRFIELDLGEIPSSEVEQIVTASCGIAPKYSGMIVKISTELQIQRQKSTFLLGKQGMVTMRDLIKWGHRQPQSPQMVAEIGYMLLCEKLRTKEEKEYVSQIINKICKSKVSEDHLYGSFDSLNQVKAILANDKESADGIEDVAVTRSFNRMWNLLSAALDNREPVLLVGETGAGKTMACQLYAALHQRGIRILNCHQTTETADIIGSLRPIRGRLALLQKATQLLSESFTVLSSIDSEVALQAWVPPADDALSAELLKDWITKSLPLLEALNEEDLETRQAIETNFQEIQRLAAKSESLFEWVDGPLVEAMKNGYIFLLDEINLAEDAVIERLNSVLEYQGELTLAEKGGMGEDGEDSHIKPHPNFRIIATMNPSGDFGKRELSPALRSRLTEIWIPNSLSFEERKLLVSTYLHIPDSVSLASNTTNEALALTVAEGIVRFTTWIQEKLMTEFGISLLVSNREIISWTKFVNAMPLSSLLDVFGSLIHGAYLTMLDGLSMLNGISMDAVQIIRHESLEMLLQFCCPTLDMAPQIRPSVESLIAVDAQNHLPVTRTSDTFHVGFFKTSLGPFLSDANKDSGAGYVLETPKVTLNVGRILRAMQIGRPILLEGPPGVGKTSLITNLAAMTGHHLVRINLSEQSELSDLLGSDLPTVHNEEEKMQSKFKWYDGIFLTAMKEGHWVLLDELNLAPQTVLEGLNACFDHRGQVFLPEIGQTVHCSKHFRIFAAQNPLREGGGRKGLPSSFLSRFTKVVFDALDEEDLVSIMTKAAQRRAAALSYSLGDDDEMETEDQSSTIASPEKVLYSDEMVQKMVRITHRLNFEATSGLTHFGKEGSPWEFNLRDVMRWCELAETIVAQRQSAVTASSSSAVSMTDVCQAAYFLFSKRMRNASDRAFIRDLFAETFGEEALRSPYASYLSQQQAAKSSKVNFGNMYRSNSGVRQHHVRYESNDITDTLTLCYRLNFPALIVGAQGSGRKSKIFALARQHSCNVRYFSAFPSLDSTEMLGSYGQATFEQLVSDVLICFEDILSTFAAVQVTNNASNLGNVEALDLGEISEQLHAAFHQISNHQNHVVSSEEMTVILQKIFDGLEDISKKSDIAVRVQLISSLLWEEKVEARFTQAAAVIAKLRRGLQAATFQWEDGAVISAIQDGEWLIFDNVNLAPASVLDRLNSLLEPHGTILLTEDGSGRKISPHPAFRVFFIMDPVFGEISRAMRNRCVEIYHDFEAVSLTSASASQLLEQEKAVAEMHTVLKQLHVELHSSRGSHLMMMLNALRELLEGYGAGSSSLQQALHRLLYRNSSLNATASKGVGYVDRLESLAPSTPLIQLRSTAALLLLNSPADRDETWTLLARVLQSHLAMLPNFAGSSTYEYLVQSNSLSRILLSQVTGSSLASKVSSADRNFLLFLLTRWTTASESHLLVNHLSDSHHQQFVSYGSWIAQATAYSSQNHALLWQRMQSAFAEFMSLGATNSVAMASEFMAGGKSLHLLSIGELLSRQVISPTSTMQMLIRELSILLKRLNLSLDEYTLHVSGASSPEVAEDMMSKVSEALVYRNVLSRLLLDYSMDTRGQCTLNPLSNDPQHPVSTVFPAAAVYVCLHWLRSSLVQLQDSLVGGGDQHVVNSLFAPSLKYLYQLWDGNEDSMSNQLVPLERPHSLPTTDLEFTVYDMVHRLAQRMVAMEGRQSDITEHFRNDASLKLGRELLTLVASYGMAVSKGTSSSVDNKAHQRSEVVLNLLRGGLESTLANLETKQVLSYLSLEDIKNEVAVKELTERETYLLTNEVILASSALERQSSMLSNYSRAVVLVTIRHLAQVKAKFTILLTKSVSDVVKDVSFLKSLRYFVYDVIQLCLTLSGLRPDALASLQVAHWLLDCMVKDDAAFSAPMAFEFFRSIAFSLLNLLVLIQRDLHALLPAPMVDGQHYYDLGLIDMYVLESQNLFKQARSSVIADNMSLVPRNVLSSQDTSFEPVLLKHVLQQCASLADSNRLVICNHTDVRKKLALDILGNVAYAQIYNAKSLPTEARDLVRRMVVVIQATMELFTELAQLRLQSALSHSEEEDSVPLLDGLLEAFHHAPTNSAAFMALIQQCLSPAVHLLRDLSRTFDASPSADSLKMLGACQVLLHTVRLHLLVPHSPLDPSQLQHCRSELLSQERSQMERNVYSGTLLRAIAGYPLADDLLVTLSEHAEGLGKRITEFGQQIFARGTSVTENEERFQEMYALLRNATQGMLSVSNVSGIVQRLLAPDAHLVANTFETQQVLATLVSNADNLCQLLRQKFDVYGDFVISIASAIQSAIQGLQLLWSAQQLSVPSLTITIKPWDQHIDSVNHAQAQVLTAIQAPISLKAENIRSLLLERLRKLQAVLLQGLLTPEQARSALYVIVLQLVELYREEEAEKRRQLTLQNSAYKNKADELEDETEEQKNEREFRSNFPNHLADLQRYMLTGNQYQDYDEDDGALNQDDTFLHKEHMLLEDDNMVLEIVSSHVQFVFIQSSAALGTSSSSSSSGLWTLHEEQQSVLSDFLRLHAERSNLSHQLHPNTDGAASHYLALELASGLYQHLDTNSKRRADESLQQQLSQLPLDRDLAYLLHPALDRDVFTEYRPRSLERDANPEEVFLALPPLQQIRDKCIALLRAFPANEILGKMMRLVLQLLHSPVTVSLSKMLFNFQVLLKCLQEWEAVAARHVSVAEEMQAVTKCIIRWRSLELKSWEDLLRLAELRSVQTALRHWFSLVKICTTDLENVLHKYRRVKLSDATSTGAADFQWWSSSVSTSNAVERGIILPEDYLTYEASMVKTFDTFLRAASVGEFPTRLHLIRTMALMLAQQQSATESTNSNIGKSTTKSSTTLKTYLHARVVRLVSGIWQYFLQYLPMTRRFMSLLKQPLHQKVKDEIKLGKWDNLNAFALLESSEKIHRKLSNIVKHYREEVLDFPVQSLVLRDLTKGLVDDSGALIPAIDIPQDNQLYPLVDRSHDLEDFLSHVLDQQTGTVSVHNNKQKSNEDFQLLLSGLPSKYESSLGRLPTLMRRTQRYVVQLFDVTRFLDDSDDDEEMDNGADKEEQGTLGNKSSSVVVDDKTVNYGVAAADLCESMSTEIFERITSLRGVDVAKNVKLRAVRDLLETLDVHGFKCLNSAIPAEVRENTSLLSLLSCTPQVLASDLCYPAMQDSSTVATEGQGGSWSLSYRNLFEKAEAYYQRNLIELLQLRTQSVTTHHSDLSHRDILSLVYLGESMQVSAVAVRVQTDQALQDYLSLQKVVQGFDGIIGTLEEQVHLQQQHQQQSIVPTESVVGSALSSDKLASRLSTLSVTQLQTLYSRVQWCFRSLRGQLLRVKLVSRTWQDSHASFTELSQSIPSLNKTLGLISSDLSVADVAQFDADLQQCLMRIGAVISDSIAVEDKKSIKKTKKVGFDTHTQLQSQFRQHHRQFNSATSKVMFCLQHTSLRVHSDDHHTNRLPIEDVCRKLMFMFETAQHLSATLLVDSNSEGEDKNVCVTLCGRHRQQRIARLVSLVLDELVGTAESSMEHNDVVEVNEEEEHKTFSLLASCVDASRLCIQRLLACTPASISTKGDKNGDENNQKSPDLSLLAQLLDKSSQTLRDFRCPALVHSVQRTLQHFACTLPARRRAPAQLSSHVVLLRHVQQLVGQVASAYDALLNQHVLAYKSFAKLHYIVLRVFRQLCAKGICSKDKAEEETDGNGGDGQGDLRQMTFEDDVEGTGMGDGEGKNDVSDQIDNEEQLLGTRDKNQDKLDELDKDKQNNEDKGADKPPKNKLDKDEKDTGVEMQQDFDGEMFDLPSDEEEEERQRREEEKQEEEENEDEEELDREMGEADMDDIVDERQWNSEDEDEDDKDQKGGEDAKEKFEKDSKMSGDKLEDEMHTRDDEDDQNEDDDGKAGKDEDKAAEKEKKNKKGDKEDEGEDENGKEEVHEEEEVMDRPRDVQPKKQQNADEEDDDGSDGDNEQGEDEDEENENNLGGDDRLPEPDQSNNDDNDLPENMQLDGDDHDDAEGDEDEDEDDEAMDAEDTFGSDADDQEEDDEDDGDANDLDRDGPDQMRTHGDQDLPPPSGEQDEEEDENQMDEDDKEADDVPDVKAPNQPDQDEGAARPVTHGIQAADGQDHIFEDAQDEDNDKDATKEGAEGEQRPKQQLPPPPPMDPQQQQNRNNNRQNQQQQQQQQGGDQGEFQRHRPEDQQQQPPQRDAKNNQRNAPQKPQPREKNPFLQMGDIEEDWHRRLNMVEDKDKDGDLHDDDAMSDDEQDTKNQQPRRHDAYEYAGQDDARESEQVLGASDKDTAVHLPQSREIDEDNDREGDDSESEEDDEGKEGDQTQRNLFDDSKDEDKVRDKANKDAGAENEDEGDSQQKKAKKDERKRDREEDDHDEDSGSDAEEHSENQKQREAKKKEKDERRRQRKKRRQEENEAENEDMDIAEDDEEEAQQQRTATNQPVIPALPLAPPPQQMFTKDGFTFGARLAESDALTTEEDPSRIAPTEDALTTNHQQRRALLSPQQIAAARTAWQWHRSQTESHALRLSETLRLILAPTLMTRLQGDYRTGKRINLRKVIPYVASGFRKDKIWLRRTKPFKRSYQVMLLIDDSQSMGASTAGSLALSSLALLSTALSRLEVGELCVASFAEEVQVLHPFGTAFTEESGVQLAANFTFQAQQTKVADCLSKTLHLFANARENLVQQSSNNNSAVMQLCFLVSDARVDSDNRAKLDTIVRTMAEQHILVVLVIIDCNADARDSIFLTKSVSFVDNKVVTKSYFDDFPFPYYVAIQEVGTLPDVLADALKQWFELIKLQLNNQQH